jgi:hypothetical protein
METTNAIRARGLRATDLADLTRSLEDGGPYVTVYLDSDPELVDAPARASIRWKDLHRDLHAAGAPAAALDAIAELIEPAHTRGAALAAVSSERGLLLEDHHDEPLVRDLGRFGALPSLGTVIEWRLRRPAHIVVLADRAGADIVGVGRHGPSGAEEDVHEVAGDTAPHDPALHKVSVGGWSQRRYQQRAENAWERDAKDVARVLEDLAGRLQPRLILLGGDERAVAMIERDLPRRLADLVQIVPGSRSADGSLAAAGGEETEEIERMIDSAVAADSAELLRALREASVKDLGTIGAAGTLVALTASQVDTLLVNDDPDDGRTAFFSRQPLAAASDADAVRDLGGVPVEARLVDVAVFLALRTGAGVRIVPAAEWLTDGIGALLRFPG